MAQRLIADHREDWQVFYGDVTVGMIGMRNGIPPCGERWSCSCGR
jgi:hypothetical protein